jgi:pimeloyl-ACP methyl ester carboxylesterase
MTRTVTAPDGRKLAVREGGTLGGIPVIVHHGTPGAGTLYTPHVLDAESKGLHLFTYDRPGYGGSTRAEHRSVADCAADVAAICDALGIDRFCTWGISGGGPHALATAALLPDRCVAAAALAPVAPWDAEGLDFFAGMGEQNVEEFGLSVRDPVAARASLERDRDELRDATPRQLVAAWSTLLPAVDVAVLKDTLALYLLDSFRTGIEDSLDGWFDDDVAFVRPWGFELGAIRVPVLHWQGGQDMMVPFGHGVWLSRQIAGVESRLVDEEGHLTLLEHRVAESHTWLAERFGG